MTSIYISGNFDSEKIDQDWIFHYKDIMIYYISSSNDPNNTHAKNHISAG
jgi:hypothetical protein